MNKICDELEDLTAKSEKQEADYSQFYSDLESRLVQIQTMSVSEG